MRARWLEVDAPQPDHCQPAPRSEAVSAGHLLINGLVRLTGSPGSTSTRSNRSALSPRRDAYQFGLEASTASAGSTASAHEPHVVLGIDAIGPLIQGPARKNSPSGGGKPAQDIVADAVQRFVEHLLVGKFLRTPGAAKTADALALPI